MIVLRRKHSKRKTRLQNWLVKDFVIVFQSNFDNSDQFKAESQLAVMEKEMKAKMEQAEREVCIIIRIPRAVLLKSLSF